MTATVTSIVQNSGGQIRITKFVIVEDANQGAEIELTGLVDLIQIQSIEWTASVGTVQPAIGYLPGWPDGDPVLEIVKAAVASISGSEIFDQVTSTRPHAETNKLVYRSNPSDPDAYIEVSIFLKDGDSIQVATGDMLKADYDPTAVVGDAFDSANHAYDNTTSGLTATDTQAAIDEVVAAGVGDMLKATYDPTAVNGDAFDSANHAYDNTASGLVAADTQAAIDELAAQPLPLFKAVQGTGQVAGGDTKSGILPSLISGMTLTTPAGPQGNSLVFFDASFEIDFGNGTVLFGIYVNGVLVPNTGRTLEPGGAADPTNMAYAGVAVATVAGDDVEVWWATSPGDTAEIGNGQFTLMTLEP